MYKQQQSFEELEKLNDEKWSAEFLGVSTRALQAWRYRGGGPLYIRISARAVRYRLRDLINFAEQRVRSSTSDQGVENEQSHIS